MVGVDVDAAAEVLVDAVSFDVADVVAIAVVDGEGVVIVATSAAAAACDCVRVSC